MGDQKNDGQGPPQLTMEQYQTSSQVHVTMAMAGQGQLPTLAPAPMQGQIQSQMSQTQGQQQIHKGGSPMQGGQPQQQMTMQQAMGQPQFQVIQPSFNPSPGQYATFPQFASYNSQGQLVLQPAPQFLQPGQPGQQGQMILTSQLPQQKPGQQNMIAGCQGQPQGQQMSGQPQQQPQYLISSTGQLQIPPGQPQMPPVTFMLAPPGIPSGMQVSMAGQQAQNQLMKASDGKSIQQGQQTLQTQPQPQLIAMPGGGMAYMQPGPQHFLQNGQIIFRAPGSQEQLMFSPSGPPPTGPPQVQAPNHQTSLPQGPASSMQQIPMQGPQGPPQRPGMSQAPPGKTAISRAIAPLLNSNSQSQPRTTYNGNVPNQPSPKSKQKMSPRGNNGNMGPGRPPGPKNQNGQLKNGQMIPRMAANGNTGSPGPQLPNMPSGGSPRPPMLQTSMGQGTMTSMAPQMMTMSGPPTLTPMMFPTQPTTLPMSTMPPMAMSMSMPTMSMAQLPTQPLDQNCLDQTATSVPMPTSVSMSDVGPPTLTKEPPMPNLGPPNLNVLPPKPKTPTPTTEQNLAPPPKAVQAVKPQVTTHIIDGHIIKESSQPFPVSPTKKRSVTGKPMNKAINEITKMLDKDIDAPNLSGPKKKEDVLTSGGVAPLKRGPGRPPGSNNRTTTPQEKKQQLPNNNTTIQTSTTNTTTTTTNPPSHDTTNLPEPDEPPIKKIKPDKIEAVTPITPLPKQIVAPTPTTPARTPTPASARTPTPPPPASPAAPPSPAPQAPPVSIPPAVAPPVVVAAPPPAVPKVNIARWSVTEVCDFIKKLPGCSDYVEDFMVQEIDGQALMLLQADHLMTAMSIRLGPALKICEQVKQLKEDFAKN